MKRPLLLVLLLALLLRLLFLGRASLQIDEAMSLLAALQWRTNPYFDVHPPLFPAMLSAWTQGGSGEAWLRTLPVLGSMLTLLFWIPVGRRLGLTSAQTLTSLLLLAVSWADLQQARELRMYAWLGAWASLYYLAVLSRRWLLAALALGAAVYTHLFGLFLVPLGWFCRPSRGRLAVLQLGVIAVWVPWAWHQAAVHAQHPFGLRQSPSVAQLVEAVGRLVVGRIEAFGDPLSLAAGALVLAWLAWSRPRVSGLLYAWAFAPWLTLWFVSLLTPLHLFEFKYLVWTLPAWAALLACSLPARPLCVAWLLANALAGWFWWLPDPHRWFANWREVARTVRTLDARIPIVVVHPSMMSAPLLYYGLGGPRLQPLDEWSQVRPGLPMIWVTTPNHPYVGSLHLLDGVRKYWKLQWMQRWESELPSSVIEVTQWAWAGPQAFSPPAEKQRSSKEVGPGYEGSDRE